MNQTQRLGHSAEFTNVEHRTLNAEHRIERVLRSSVPVGTKDNSPAIHRWEASPPIRFYAPVGATEAPEPMTSHQGMLRQGCWGSNEVSPHTLRLLGARKASTPATMPMHHHPETAFGGVWPVVAIERNPISL